MVMVTASEARASLPDLLSRVEEVTITRHGRPVAVLVRPDALRARHAQAALDGAERIHQLLAGAASAPPERTGLTEARAEELIAEIRAGRDRAADAVQRRGERLQAMRYEKAPSPETGH